MEDIIPAWPDTGEEEYGVFFTRHDVDVDLPHQKRVVKWVENTIHEEGYDLSRLDFVFCSDEFLLDINRKHLGHDDYTDIITFPLNDNPLIAEIYISTDRVRENAASYRLPFHDELLRVIIHGVLHLCGYDDQDEEDIRNIRKKEEEYLKKINRA